MTANVDSALYNARRSPTSFTGRVPAASQYIKELDQSAPAIVFGVQRLPGDLYFYRKLLAGEKIPKLYMRYGLKGEERLIVDPDKVD